MAGLAFENEEFPLEIDSCIFDSEYSVSSLGALESYEYHLRK